MVITLVCLVCRKGSYIFHLQNNNNNDDDDNNNKQNNKQKKKTRSKNKQNNIKRKSIHDVKIMAWYSSARVVLKVFFFFNYNYDNCRSTSSTITVRSKQSTKYFRNS